MSRKKELAEQTATETVTITGISAEGQAVTRLNDKVVFVEGAVPGDVCTLYIYKSKKSFSLARVANLLIPSPHRVEPRCSHFGTCGGCTWQHLDYKAQLDNKQKQVFDAFKHLGGLDIAAVLRPIIGSDAIYEYRNRLDYACADRVWLPPEQFNTENFTAQPGIGFHMPGSFSKVLDIVTCHLQSGLSNDIRHSAKQFCIDNAIPFFNNYKKEGVLRSLLVRNAVFTDQWLVMVMVYTTHPMLDALMAHLHETFPQITSLYYVINPKVNDTFYDLPLILYSGADTIEEELDGIRYRIHPKSFFQTNSRQALQLFKTALDLAELKPHHKVYDLYTGTGSMALMVAKHVAHVTGVELVPEAIEDAYINASLNHISNVSFFSGDMAKILNPAFIAQNGVPDVVITDPPRAGMHEKVVQMLLELNVPRIVYISCNPATQARDIALLSHQYIITAAQPIDMFPHTKHVENVVVLERKTL